jgi:hypothetical protein
MDSFLWLRLGQYFHNHVSIARRMTIDGFAQNTATQFKRAEKLIEVFAVAFP